MHIAAAITTAGTPDASLAASARLRASARLAVSPSLAVSLGMARLGQFHLSLNDQRLTLGRHSVSAVRDD